MFRRITEDRGSVTLIVDGRPVAAFPDDSVSAALLAAGVAAFRTNPVDGRPRGPYCGMGVCFDCLVTIDGVANRQACLTQVRDGMRVETGGGRPRLAEMAP